MYTWSSGSLILNEKKREKQLKSVSLRTKKKRIEMKGSDCAENLYESREKSLLSLQRVLEMKK